MSDIPATMRAMVLTGHGGMDKLEYREDYPTPSAGPGEVLIKVSACGLNNTDVNTRTGWYSRSVSDGTTEEGGSGGFDGIDSEAATWGRVALTFPRIQGADVCGTVVAVGAGADEALIGQRVLIDTWLRNWEDPWNRDEGGYFGSESDGGFADYTVAPVKNVHPVRSSLSDAELATFATSSVTAENMLFRANVGPGDLVLIPGASGGVGSALIQLANRRGATTIAMCGDSKRDQVQAIGPSAILAREPGDLSAALEAAIGCSEVDVVADVVGGKMFNAFIEILKPRGRYTCAGAIAGPMVSLDLRTFYLKDLTFTGATVVPPTMFGDLVGYIEREEIKPLLAKTWPLRDFKAAQEAFLAKAHVGNIVVTLD